MCCDNLDMSRNDKLKAVLNKYFDSQSLAETGDLRKIVHFFYTYECISFFSVSHKNYWMCCDNLDMSRNDKLKAVLNEYFNSQPVTYEKLYSIFTYILFHFSVYPTRTTGCAVTT